jgi:hypothetical protein
VGGLIGGATTLFLIAVLGIYFAIDPPLLSAALPMLPRESRPFFRDTNQMDHHAPPAVWPAGGHGDRRGDDRLALAPSAVPMAALLG